MLKEIFEKLDIVYTDEKEQQLIGYMEEILDRNRFVNLTAITDREEFLQKHYLDSLSIAGSDEFLRVDTVIDVGTGGGFPGVPLAVCFPEKEFVLIDSLNKRIRIINELCKKLEIRNVRALHGRAEELGRRKDLRERFDLCVSRAVANMSVLCEYCLPFVKVGGSFIAYKGPECRDEVDAAEFAIEVLGGSLLRLESPRMDILPFNHKLIIVSKMRQTTSKYPRKAGTPSKEPISR